MGTKSFAEVMEQFGREFASFRETVVKELAKSMGIRALLDRFEKMIRARGPDR